MKILILALFSLLFEAPQAHALEVGQLVLSRCGRNFHKARVTDMLSENRVILKYFDWTWNFVCGEEITEIDFFDRNVFPYLPTEEYVERNLFGSPTHILHIGDRIERLCGGFYQAGTINDLSQNGYILVVLDNDSWNEACQGFTRVSTVRLPSQEN